MSPSPFPALLLFWGHKSPSVVPRADKKCIHEGLSPLFVMLSRLLYQIRGRSRAAAAGAAAAPDNGRSLQPGGGGRACPFAWARRPPSGQVAWPSAGRGGAAQSRR